MSIDKTAILANATKNFQGVLIRHLSQKKAITFLTSVLTNEELQALTDKSASLVSKIKNGKREFSEDDKLKLYSWYTYVSLYPINSSDVTEDYLSSDSEPLYNIEDVRSLERQFNLLTYDMDKAYTRFKQDTRETLKAIKKKSPR